MGPQRTLIQSKPTTQRRLGRGMTFRNPSASTMSAKEDEPQHRGRLQVQGKDMAEEHSFPWAQNVPMGKARALLELATLKARLTKRALKLRDEAFIKAEKFITAILTTAPPRVFRTFQNSELIDERDKIKKTARVDIEIQKGAAFV